MRLTEEGVALLRRIESRAANRLCIASGSVSVEERREFRKEKAKLLVNRFLGEVKDKSLEGILRELIFDLAEKVDWGRVADGIERERPELIPLEDELYSRK